MEENSITNKNERETRQHVVTNANSPEILINNIYK